MNRIYVVAVVLLVTRFPVAQTRAEQKRTPETVLVTFQVQKDQELRLQQVLSKAMGNIRSPRDGPPRSTPAA
jgi:hypothetical protein